MSESETSESDEPDIDECVSMAYNKFIVDSSVVEAECGENSLLSLSASAAYIRQDDTSPKNSCATNLNRFVS